MQKIKISTVSYLNAEPFIFGINNSEIKNEIELSLDIPSVCAEKLIINKVDAGLIPITVIPELYESHIITNYCIGATGKVNSVLLLSEVPLHEIKTILLDYQSRTSVELVKIICANHWIIKPDFQNSNPGYENEINNSTAGLVIGDRALILKNKFNYAYDLSQAWFEMTSLPFVFACWVSNKKLEKSFVNRFNTSLKHGVENIEKVIDASMASEISSTEKMGYLKNNISYFLDEEKKKGMKLFFEFLREGKVKEKSVLIK